MALTAPTAVSIARAASLLSSADALLVTCGAGMSVDSGMPDFRGPDGFWAAFPPLQRLGLRFSDIAHPQKFFENPTLTWGFYGTRMNMYRRAAPHEGYTTLTALARSKFGDRSFVFTSNVDGLWEKSGWHAERLVECHGSIHVIQCADPTQCVGSREAPHLADAVDVEGRGGDGMIHAAAAGGANARAAPVVVDIHVDAESLRAAPESIPRCPRGCSGIARPNIMLFGDPLFILERTRAQEQRFAAWQDSLGDTTHLCVIDIGSGTAIPTVRWTAESIALRFAARPGCTASLIRINVREPEVAWSGHRSGPLPESVQLPLGAREAIVAVIGAMG